MRKIITIVVAIVGLCSTLSAQNIRLGEKVPAISVVSTLGDKLQLIEQEHTCLLFMHSQCEPCIKALPELHKMAAPLSDRLAIVLLTNESSEMEATLKKRFGSYVSAIAFDNARHTYQTFGINFVPFVVIYQTKSRRIEWFGSMQQLDNQQLMNICNNKK